MHTTFRLALAATLFALLPAAASAQTVQLLCTFPSISGGNLVTVDYSAQMFGSDNIDAAGNITIDAFHRMPAKITDENVSAAWRNGEHYLRFTLNRYSGVMRKEADFGSGYSSVYSNPCTPYQRGAKKF